MILNPFKTLKWGLGANIRALLHLWPDLSIVNRKSGKRGHIFPEVMQETNHFSSVFSERFNCLSLSLCHKTSGCGLRCYPQQPLSQQDLFFRIRFCSACSSIHFLKVSKLLFSAYLVSVKFVKTSFIISYSITFICLFLIANNYFVVHFPLEGMKII